MAGEYLVSKKYHEISVLAGETAKQVAKNGKEWTKYLDTAARLYKYPFEEQRGLRFLTGRANAQG